MILTPSCDVARPFRDGGREGAINQLDEMVYPPPEGRTDGRREGGTDSDAVH